MHQKGINFISLHVGWIGSKTFKEKSQKSGVVWFTMCIEQQ